MSAEGEHEHEYTAAGVCIICGHSVLDEDDECAAKICIPCNEHEAEDLAVFLANEIRHDRPITLYWARRNGKRRLTARVNELLGAQV